MFPNPTLEEMGIKHTHETKLKLDVKHLTSDDKLACLDFCISDAGTNCIYCERFPNTEFAKGNNYDMDTYTMIIELDNGTALHYEFEDVHSLGALQKFIGSFLCSKDHQPNVQIKTIQISSPK